MGGEFGGEDSCICMAESLQCSPETITTLLIGYTLIQNKKQIKNRQNNSVYLTKKIIQIDIIGNI